MGLQDKYNNCSDQELINNYLERDDSVYVGVLYERYGYLVLGLCIKYLRNKDEARDTALHIFSSLLTDLKKYRIEYFKSWLFVYSKNHCLMVLRKRQSLLKKALELKENNHLLMDFHDPEHLKEKEAQIVSMERAISELNETQKKCIELFYLQSKSYSEISSITGMTSNEVKTNIQNGKRNLKIKMESFSDEQQRK